jgi:hypothetical protein
MNSHQPTRQEQDGRGDLHSNKRRVGKKENTGANEGSSNPPVEEDILSSHLDSMVEVEKLNRRRKGKLL